MPLVFTMMAYSLMLPLANEAVDGKGPLPRHK